MIAAPAIASRFADGEEQRAVRRRSLRGWGADVSFCQGQASAIAAKRLESQNQEFTAPSVKAWGSSIGALLIRLGFWGPLL